MTVKTAVFPVAGLGTRFLPATKVIPKELLNLVDRPLIEYAVDEARNAGIEKFIFVTGRGKNAIIDHFDYSYELDDTLERRGKDQLLSLSRRMIDQQAGSFIGVRQLQASGLGHAVWSARKVIGDDPFCVILPDEIIQEETPGDYLKLLISTYNQTNQAIVGVMETSMELMKNYGCVAPKEDNYSELSVVSVEGIIEKPEPSVAPSNLAAMGRYVFSSSILDELGVTRPGVGGEIQLTDAITNIISSEGCKAVKLTSQRFDCGSKSGLFEAYVTKILEHPELRDRAKAFLKSVVC